MKRVILNYLVIAAIAVAAVFTSCKKDTETVYTVKLLKTITVCCIKSDGHDENIGKYDKYKFEYDEQNRITKMSEYSFDGDLSYTNAFTYDGDDLVQVLYSHSGGFSTSEYTKNGNIITEKCNGTTYTIELDIDGLPVKLDRGDGKNYDIYEYQDGNLTEKTGIFELPEYDYTEYHRYSYGYDNQKGALYHCNTPKWYLVLHLSDFGVKNNKTDEYWTRHWGEYIYEFDSAEFPAKRTYKNTWGMAGHVKEWVEKFTYIKK